MESLRENIKLLESSLDREFGSSTNPLLVSVRSGAPASMPGMMDTILNLGINDEMAEGLAGLMHNPRAAYDAHRRFLQIYASVVLEESAMSSSESLPTPKPAPGSPRISSYARSNSE